ncbi:MAG: amino acid racemase [Peptococcaceae bacterium]|jgi:aspartate racemase|nr:amino acid racemase [Peptococcaceae bacterium]
MRKIGIIGGIGPASTLDYYSGIIEGYRAKTNDGSYPEIIIDSVNMTEMLSYVENEDWSALTDMLVKAIDNVSAAGAQFAAIASNTPHIVFDSVQKRSALPLVSIVDETCRYAQAKGCKEVVIIGTRFTMGSGLYTKAFAKFGIATVTPSADEQEKIHGIIFPKLEDGIVDEGDKQKLLALAKRLISGHGADALVLGCTELPLMIKDGDLDTLTLNTTQIHIDAIVNALN